MNDPYDDYQGDDGPRLVQSAVLFLDVLGTASPRTPEESADHLRLTRDAFVSAQQLGSSKPGTDGLTIATWFSDNLAMALPLPETSSLRPGSALSLLVMYAGLHQLALAEHGLFARGAITLGPFYADREFIYGDALIEAYRLESSTALFPRVIVSDDAYTALVNDRNVNDLFDDDEDYLLVGDDGWPFVDYLRYMPNATPYVDETLELLDSSLEKALAEVQRVKDRTKLRWLAGYHNGMRGTSIGGIDGRTFTRADPAIRRKEQAAQKPSS